MDDNNEISFDEDTLRVYNAGNLFAAEPPKIPVEQHLDSNLEEMLEELNQTKTKDASYLKEARDFIEEKEERKNRK